MTYDQFVLPPSIVTKVDVARLVSEFEQVDNDLTTAGVRAKTAATGADLPLLSPQLTEFLRLNRLQPSSSAERSELVKQLRLLKDSVPTIHMTFAVEADRKSLEQLVAWLRASVHSQAVIAVGLQPALVAGVYLRTPNHVHDLSLRAMLKNGSSVLAKDLQALRGAH
ncbi:MAG: hypothetical protein WBO49_02830 [Candidatus Saccharimonas sp.]